MRWSRASPSIRSAATIALDALVQRRIGCRTTTAPSTSTCSEQRDLRAVDVVFACEANLAPVPAVGQDGAQLVLARTEQRADVVGLHLTRDRYAVKPGVSSWSPTRSPSRNSS